MEDRLLAPPLLAWLIFEIHLHSTQPAPACAKDSLLAFLSIAFLAFLQFLATYKCLPARFFCALLSRQETWGNCVRLELSLVFRCSATARIAAGRTAAIDNSDSGDRTLLLEAVNLTLGTKCTQNLRLFSAILSLYHQCCRIANILQHVIKQ